VTRARPQFLKAASRLDGLALSILGRAQRFFRFDRLFAKARLSRLSLGSLGFGRAGRTSSPLRAILRQPNSLALTGQRRLFIRPADLLPSTALLLGEMTPPPSV
jgi:hypothetical protein